MPSHLTAGIAVENTAYSFDKLFHYLIPESMSDSVRPGCRVLVGFGNGKKERVGFVFKLSDCVPEGVKNVKPIIGVIDNEPVLSDEMLRLAERLADRCFCTLFDAAKAMLPTGANIKATESFCISPDYYKSGFEAENFTEDELRALNYIGSKSGFSESDAVYKRLGISPETGLLNRLCEKGCLIKNTGAKRRLNDASVKTVSLAPEYADGKSIPFKATKKQESVIKLLRDIGFAASKEIAYYTGVTQTVIDNLFKRGIVVYDDTPVYRLPEKLKSTPRDNSPIELTELQQSAYAELKQMLTEPKASAALLFGVTGSGKTKVYMRLVDDIAAENRGAIILVPEIALTPQLLTMFYSRYGEKVAVLHSGLSIGERLDEWKRIKNGEANIVVGTRSAVFAQVKNLAAIIIDEEQESTYKSEMTPRYHARDAAKFRCAYNNALLVLSSATPSVETYARARAGGCRLIEMSERYSKTGLPDVITVDVSQKENMDNMRTVSSVLAREIEYNLKNNQQTILLINRRGYNTFIACTKCKNIVMCPNCSISMTYHIANGRMMCHYCGYSEPVTPKCPECGADTIRFSGFGTQKVEQELENLFPDAKILRMDADTTSAKNSHEKRFNLFAKGEYDIMVGTQMVAKGLDFPNVTLVGVISVDQLLYNDDYKSAERTFDLLTQVVGRSGRGEKTGRAVIQTLAPENMVISLAAEQNYKAFFDAEIRVRKGMIYPPYCDICVLSFNGAGETDVKTAARAFFNLFKKRLESDYAEEKVIVLGPVAPKIAKVNNNYRERLIIKCKNTFNFRKLVSECLKEFSGITAYNKVTAFADMNPESIF